MRRLTVILWISFLVAGIAEGAVFSLIDPRDMHTSSGTAELPSLGVYTVGFFFLWFFCALAAALSSYLTNEDRSA